MPPSRYTFIHANAQLSPAEREEIHGWAHAERRRLKSAPPVSGGDNF